MLFFFLPLIAGCAVLGFVIGWVVGRHFWGRVGGVGTALLLGLAQAITGYAALAVVFRIFG
jgi:hypothetical protein